MLLLCEAFRGKGLKFEPCFGVEPIRLSLWQRAVVLSIGQAPVRRVLSFPVPIGWRLTMLCLVKGVLLLSCNLADRFRNTEGFLREH